MTSYGETSGCLITLDKDQFYLFEALSRSEIADWPVPCVEVIDLWRSSSYKWGHFLYVLSSAWRPVTCSPWSWMSSLTPQQSPTSPQNKSLSQKNFLTSENCKPYALAIQFSQGSNLILCKASFISSVRRRNVVWRNNGLPYIYLIHLR